MDFAGKLINSWRSKKNANVHYDATTVSCIFDIPSNFLKRMSAKATIWPNVCQHKHAERWTAGVWHGNDHPSLRGEKLSLMTVCISSFFLVLYVRTIMWNSLRIKWQWNCNLFFIHRWILTSPINTPIGCQQLGQNAFTCHQTIFCDMPLFALSLSVTFCHPAYFQFSSNCVVQLFKGCHKKHYISTPFAICFRQIRFLGWYIILWADNIFFTIKWQHL